MRRVAVLLALGPIALVAGAAPAPTVTIRTERAKVEGDDGAGLFVIARDSYVFARIGNPNRRAMEYDPLRRRVRISPAGKTGMWIQCGYLAPVPGMCAAPARAAAPPVAAAALPVPAVSPTPTASPSAPAKASGSVSADDIILQLTGVAPGDSKPAPEPTATAPATRGFSLARPTGAAPATKGFSIARPTRAAPARAAPSSGASAAPAALPDCPGDPRCP